MTGSRQIILLTAPNRCQGAHNTLFSHAPRLALARAATFAPVFTPVLTAQVYRERFEDQLDFYWRALQKLPFNPCESRGESER